MGSYSDRRSDRRGRLAKGKAAAAGLLLAAALVPVGAGTSVAAPAPGPSVAPHLDSTWIGYVVTGNPGDFTSISGSWTEPAFTCDSYDDTFAAWIGLDGYDDATVEQTGVQTDCSSGTPVLTGWYELYPAAPVYWSGRVSQGDKLDASVVYGDGTYTLTLSDTTQGWTQHVSKAVTAQNASAEAILESPTGSFPSFPSFTFTDLLVNGEPMGDFDPIQLGGGGVVVTPFAGDTFSVTPGFGVIRH
jgi:hypothetical protein